MAADFNQPTISNTHVNIWPQVKDNNTALAQMFSAGSSANIPLRAVRFLNNTLYLWSGTVWDIAPVAIGGGGTGSQTAAAARVALGTNDASNIDTGSLSADRIPTLDITTKTSGTIPEARVPTLQGEKTVQASTTVRGTTQLNDTLTSTSTSLALTAAQGKALKDENDSLLLTINKIISFKLNFVPNSYSVVSIFGSVSGMTATRLTTGSIQVNHNFGSSSYSISVNGIDIDLRHIAISSVNNNSFKLQIVDASSSAVDDDLFITIHKGF